MLTSAIATMMLTAPAANAQPPSAFNPPKSVDIKYVKKIPSLRPLAFAPGPDGAKIAMTMEDMTVRLFDAKNRETYRTFKGHPQPAYAIAWSNDGAWLATGDESARIFLWDARTGKKLREMRGHQRGIQSLSFNDDRSLLLSTGKDDAVKLWNLSNGKELKTVYGNGANLYSATFLPHSSSFICGTLGGGARLYDAKSGKHSGSYKAQRFEEVNDVAINPSGSKFLASGRQGMTCLWDFKSRKPLGKFVGHADWVLNASFSPNGKLVATSSVDRTVRVYDASNFRTVSVIEGQSLIGSPIGWTSDGKWLLTLGDDDTLQIHSVAPAQPMERSKNKR